MSGIAFIAIFLGVLTLAGLYWWVRQREEVEKKGLSAVVNSTARESEDSISAVIVASGHGTILHTNRLLQNWLGMEGIEPDIEDILRVVQPTDHFLGLLSHESSTSFQIGEHWVEANSHVVPHPEGARMVVVMRELVRSQGTAQSPQGVMDVTKAMTVVNSIGESINAGMGIESALQMILEIVNRALPSDAGEICMWNDSRNFLQQRGWIGDTRYLLTIAAQGGGYNLGEGVAGWVAQYKKPILISGGEGESFDSQNLMHNAPYTSAVGIPLQLNEELVGTITLFSNALQKYTAEDVSLLQVVSKAISTAVRNAELYAKQEDRIRDIASLQQIAEQPKGVESSVSIYGLLNERMAKLLDADMCGVLLYEPTRESLMPQLPFYGLPDHVADKIIIPLPEESLQHEIWKNQPYWVSNDVKDEPLAENLGLSGLIEAAGIENTALFPMQIAGERIGVMAISNTKGGFMPNDIQNLRVLSSQAAIVVENVRLYQREQRIDTELVGLQEMTYAIGALSHEGEFYQEITERVARLMESSMCGVLLYDEGQQALVSQLPFYGLSDEVISGYKISLPDGSIMEQLWRDEDYWYSNNVMTDTLLFEAGLEQIAEQTEVTKTLIAVIAASGRRIGVVQVSNKLNNSDFDEKDARLLQIFATQAGAIIVNARLYHEVQTRADQADRMRRIAELASSTMTTQESFQPILREIAELTNSEVAFINLLDPNTNLLLTYPRWVYGTEPTELIIQDIGQEGYEKLPAHSGQSLVIPDVSTVDDSLAKLQTFASKLMIRNMTIIPLAVGDRNLGEIGVANRREGTYTSADLAPLGTAAAQIASSVERLMLYEATGENLRRRVEELDAIARVSNELTLTVELDKILSVIRDEAAKATYADASTILILRPADQWIIAGNPEVDQRVGITDGLENLAPIELEAIRRGAEPFVVSDYENNDLAAIPTSARSAAAAAILYLDQVVGVIHVYDKKPSVFDERASGFLMTLSAKASLAYQNSLLYKQQMERGERLRQRVEQLNRIFELGQMVHSDTDPVDVLEAIAYSIQQSIGFDVVLMTLFDDDGLTLRRVAQAGMPIEAFKKSQANTLTRDSLDEILKEEYQISESYFFPIDKVRDWYSEAINVLGADYESNRSVEARGTTGWHDGDMLLVTITGQNNDLLGIISLDRPHDNLRPQRATIEVLEIFSHQASTMIENTRMFRKSQRDADHEAMLNDTLEAVSGTLDLKDMTVSLATGVHDLVGFDLLTLVLANEQEDAFDYFRASFNEDGDPVIDESQHSTLDRTALGRTFNERKTYIYAEGDEEIKKYDDLRSWYGKGEKSSIILPLSAGGECLGALHLGSNLSRLAMSRKETIQLLTRTSQIVASTVQNARLFNQTMNLQVLNRSVVESIQQGIVVLDNSGRIISINEFMRQVYGWSDIARGKDLFEYQPELSAYLMEDLRGVLEKGEQRERIGEVAPGSDTVRNFYLYPLRSRDHVRGAVLLVEDVTERTRLEEAIETRANQLAALTEVSTRITASLEREEIIQLAMDEMGWIIPFDTMTMWRRSGTYMLLEGAAGFEQHLDEDLGLQINAIDLVTQIVDTQRVVGITGENQDLPHIGLPGDELIHSWMGVPLVNQGHVVGMFILTRNQHGDYESRQEQHVAFAFASQVAIALANADLFEQTFERTNELGTLLEAAQATSLTRDLSDVFRTVAELMFSALEMGSCIIMIWDEVENQLDVQFSGNRMGDDENLVLPGTRYHVAEYHARERALDTREVVVVVDTDDTDVLYKREIEDMRETGVAARMLVPLVVRDHSMGVIQLDQNMYDEESLNQQKVRLARALGSQVAVAIENARLTGETTSRFEELLTINQLSQSISSTLKLESMLPIIREQVPQVTSAEELYLALYDAETETITFPLAVRESGEEFVIPARKLGNDEVSYIIQRKHSLSLGADYFSIDELRKSMRIENGEGDVKAYMGVPLKSGDQVLGVLAIRNMQKRRAFTLNDDRILTTVGSQLGAAIQNARLFEQIQESAEKLEGLVAERTDELEEERDRLDTLYQITSELSRTLDMEQLLDRSLGMVSKAVGADDGVIMLSDPATDNLYSRAWIDSNNLIYLEEDGIHTHPAEGLATWLIHQGDVDDHVVLVHDLAQEEYWGDIGRQTDLRSALAVMLENNEDPMGVMVLLSKEVGAFTENHLKLLVPAANQVAASINSADLYQLIRDQAERMGRLLRSEQEEAQKNSAILQSIADGVMLANSEGSIILFNTAAERILELPRDEALGQNVSKLGGLYGPATLRWTQMLGDWAQSQDAMQLRDETIQEQVELEDKIISIQLSPVYSNGLFIGTVSVFRDITKDVEADRAKTKFIENVSHEFRTPLTSIKGYADLLLMNAAGELPESQRQFVGTIKNNTERLTALVEDVLNISKLDSGEDTLHMSMVDIKKMTRDIFDTISNEARNRANNIDAKLQIEENIPLIRADFEKLEETLRNIIDNGFSYTKPGGSVAVSVRRDPDHDAIMVEVADTGVGIPEEFREAVWRRFERHDQTAVELDIAGTGLGLSLAKELVRLHNGEIWFESEVGVGTTFFIRLPIEQPHLRTSTAELPAIDETETLAGD